MGWGLHEELHGTRGKTVAMHPLTWHYSHPNESDAPRVLASVIFNDLDNVPVQPAETHRRPEVIVHSPPG